ncbi:MAG: hypothetical protein SFV81_09250 [Pirellulaceae bacterium]|nr:hypothetical protein [Pirellulaceae bacterium]
MDALAKQKKTRLALSLVLIAVVSWKFFYPILAQPLQAKQELIASETRGLESLQSRFDLYSNYLAQIRSTGMKSLPPDSMTAAIRYQEWVRGLCETAGMAEPTLTIKEPVLEEDVGAKVQVSIRATASLEAVGNLVDLLSAAAVAHRIVKLELKDWDALGSSIALSIDLDALSLKDNPTFNPNLLAQSIETRGLGRFIDDRKSFSRYVPPQRVPIEMEPGESMAVSTARPPRPDFLNAVLLVGIVQRNGAPRALLRDNLKGVDLVYELNQQIQVDDFSATVTSIDGVSMTLAQGDKIIRVALGQTLRQSVDWLNEPNGVF